MPDFFTLSCPTCGGKLQITNDIERFACGNCGNEHLVHRSGGIVSLTPVIEGLKQVQVGVDKTASELALKRLKKEVEELNLLKINRKTGSVMFSILGGIPILIGILGILAGIGGTVTFIIVGAIGLTLIWGGNSYYNGQVAEIEEEIQKRMQELAKHQVIVSQ